MKIVDKLRKILEGENILVGLHAILPGIRYIRHHKIDILPAVRLNVPGKKDKRYHLLVIFEMPLNDMIFLCGEVVWHALLNEHSTIGKMVDGNRFVVGIN